MPSDSTTQVSIYYGPLSWFRKQLGRKERTSLLEIAYEREEAGRRHVFVVEGQERSDEDEQAPRPHRVVAESGDYASFQEHVITNFAGYIHSINPKHLALHNPPAQVHAQLARTFPDMKVERYAYPAVTRDTLVKFRDGFGAHLVGQEHVKDSLLAALYPLTTGRRTKPVVLMFFGPSGVGKTETAQFVNGLLDGDLLRKQFSMFHSDKFASYLFGGSHSEESLARDLLDRESGVILIDEFDKANSVFHSAFYQVFDSGVFEDKNYRVDLGPALIICTSNYESEGDVRRSLGEALYSRFDAMVQFQPLSKEEILEVISRVVDDRFDKLAPDERERLDLEFVKSRLSAYAANDGNVRRLGKLIDGTIAYLLVQSVLEEEVRSV